MQEQKKAGAKFMLFHGWKLPSEFSSARKEHLNVRKNAGLFDISHMGQIRVKGHQALFLLQKTLTNQVDKLKKNEAQYNLMCHERGGVIDDLILYCVAPGEDYILCVNTACIKKDFNWLLKHNTFQAHVTDESSQWAGLALQGPKALELLITALFDKTGTALLSPSELKAKSLLTQLKKNQYLWLHDVILVSATGYTGEKGFELFLPPQKAPALWRKLLEVSPSELCPVGLLSRDTLRLESQYPLYGQELSEDIDPYSAKLSWAVKNKTDFIGSQALSQIQIKKKRVSFILASKELGDVFHCNNGEPMGITEAIPTPLRVPRIGNRILIKAQAIGEVTSGAFSPTLSAMIGMGYVMAEHAPMAKNQATAKQIQVEIQGELYPAFIVPRFRPH